MENQNPTPQVVSPTPPIAPVQAPPNLPTQKPKSKFPFILIIAGLLEGGFTYVLLSSLGNITHNLLNIIPYFTLMVGILLVALSLAQIILGVLLLTTGKGKKLAKILLITTPILIIIFIPVTIISSMNSVYKELGATPSPSPELVKTSPTPTSDLTTDWKTYTNSKYNFSVDYPTSLKLQIFPTSTYDTFSFISNDISKNGVNIHIDPVSLNASEDLKSWLLKNTYGSTGPVPRTTLPPPTIYPYVNAIDSSITGFWEESGSEVLSKHIYLKKKNVIFEFSVHGLQAGDNYKDNPKAQVILERMISSFILIDQNQTTDTSNWKTYQGKDFSIKYPPNLTPGGSMMLVHGVSFGSSDLHFTYGNEIDSGYMYNFVFGSEIPSNSAQKTIWLGKTAYFELSSNNLGNAYASLSNTDISFELLSPKSDTDHKIFNENKDIFYAIANSLKLK